MEDFPQTPDDDLKESQAVLDDYRSSSSNPEYTKGHLTPVCHQETLHDREATYTLTNIVPQRAASNNGPWSALEKKMLNKIKPHCTGEMYVITGAIPYQNERLLKERVSIPEYMWSAYCCPEYTSTPYLTYAAVGRNDPDSGNDIVERGRNSKGYDVKEMTVQDLENILERRLNMQIMLFRNKCIPTGE
ncbi:endonuclease domain-containing 1 protein-like [Betta splendens]|uniref:Endonuclease domain-containing 1 protein-like n=1 Tax=Betta splendens TaxID=158456 RepID=A0A6P7NW98_BETSP|nr:endonuclease domain-containing 1 protein-like [Betta splendens]